jgi:hypothetical protein
MSSSIALVWGFLIPRSFQRDPGLGLHLPNRRLALP